MYFQPCIGKPHIFVYNYYYSGGPTLGPRVKIVAKKSPSRQPANLVYSSVLRFQGCHHLLLQHTQASLEARGSTVTVHDMEI